jgi:hypothetical protein
MSPEVRRLILSAAGLGAFLLLFSIGVAVVVNTALALLEGSNLPDTLL